MILARVVVGAVPVGLGYTGALEPTHRDSCEPSPPSPNVPPEDEISTDTSDRCGGLVIAACGAHWERCGFPRQCGL